MKFLLDYVDCSFIASDLSVLHPTTKQASKKKEEKQTLQASFAKMKSEVFPEHFAASDRWKKINKVTCQLVNQL